ncbi:hypothetical protein [Pedobacter sp.]|uniref:hypothetical protein n=1 Tax=Pedobacter sp. TaxID=1411316 RepID=UPI003D7FD304
MKIILTPIMAIAAIYLLLPENNVLTNTKWKGTLYIPDSTEVSMEFKVDTLFAYSPAELLETNSFKVKGDTLIMQKISGMSDCDTSEAKYHYTIVDNVLKINTLADNCQSRAAAFSGQGYHKIQ